MQHFTAPGVDSFVSLFHEFGFNQLRPYNEAWSASAECIAHLRKTLQESNSRGLPLRGELSWAAIDKRLCSSSQIVAHAHPPRQHSFPPFQRRWISSSPANPRQLHPSLATLAPPSLILGLSFQAPCPCTTIRTCRLSNSSCPSRSSTYLTSTELI